MLVKIPPIYASVPLACWADKGLSVQSSTKVSVKSIFITYIF